MANEWTVVELRGANRSGEQVRFTVADGTAVSQGTLCSLTDPRTTTGVAASAAMISGVASMDKEALDGSTSISVWTDGIFEARASGAFQVGVPLRSAGSNQVAQSDTDAASGAAIIGYALETASANETVNVRLRL